MRLPGGDDTTRRARGAIGLARLILAAASFDLRPGGAPASAFLIDMNKVFEDFAVIALREALRVSDRVLVQGARGRPLFLDVHEQVSLKPDLSYWAGPDCLLVGDVKYKRIQPAGYPNADLYQLTAYTIAAKLGSGMLIYAAGEAGDQVHHVRHLGTRLLQVPLDLRVPPADILAQVAGLASRIALAATVAA